MPGSSTSPYFSKHIRFDIVNAEVAIAGSNKHRFALRIRVRAVRTSHSSGELF